MQQQVDFLIANGYIDYGKVIPKHIIEEIVGCSSSAGWSFLGPYLELKMQIEENGYFCTSKGCTEGELKILEAAEMSMRAEKILQNVLKKKKRAQTTMLNADVSILNKVERDKHDHAALKLTLTIQAHNNVLNRF